MRPPASQPCHACIPPSIAASISIRPFVPLSFLPSTTPLQLPPLRAPRPSQPSPPPSTTTEASFVFSFAPLPLTSPTPTVARSLLLPTTTTTPTFQHHQQPGLDPPASPPLCETLIDASSTTHQGFPLAPLTNHSPSP
ncbi:hypothetical protein JDV02_009642 [Purpureocillium takamizusanense]|uniref:Uncharacterized protein n=1 Tax=Purpureocillium takamizusanense TaxID=2060973 RepID=A0A9Q8QSC4_9HYPO|nr:uncharacterized protein JDV02_009642 [Purpureocillium takamizusanense]UNI23849.1 hypothetical protein JDV02_009642 [Purpureocillium takamizusanense]